ncbi:hypothetical protein SAMD00019534_049740, partial [Acytostelium subglobosum LB1]|uniref:hypothetical protein n=1 Tax=Acytostelium subglobosum LB1 TaxID=1410327 RepID=UPI000644A41A
RLQQRYHITTLSSENYQVAEGIQEILKGILEGRILEIFDKYYHKDIVMYEKGDSTNRVGKAANRIAEESFIKNATFHEARVEKLIIDGNNTAYQMYLDFTYGGHRVQKTQWAMQEWKDGLVIKEEF